MRLDQQSWDALRDICMSENISLHDLCSMIDSKRGNIGLSTATRIFLVSYLRHSIRKLQDDHWNRDRDSSYLLEVMSGIYA